MTTKRIHLEALIAESTEASRTVAVIEDPEETVELYPDEIVRRWIRGGTVHKGVLWDLFFETWTGHAPPTPLGDGLDYYQVFHCALNGYEPTGRVLVCRRGDTLTIVAEYHSAGTIEEFRELLEDAERAGHA